MSVCCECCVLSGRGLCDELITRSKESYRLWCVVACDLETSRMRRPWLALGGSTTRDGDRLVYIGVYLKSVLIYINNYPTRCNTKQSIYYSVSSLYMFRVSTTPIIRSTQNLTTDSGTGHIFCAATSIQRGQPAQKIWPVRESAVTVLCTPDDGCGWHPKHVEWTCRIINRLLCVASRWTVINTDQQCTEPWT